MLVLLQVPLLSAFATSSSWISLSVTTVISPLNLLQVNLASSKVILLGIRMFPGLVGWHICCIPESPRITMLDNSNSALSQLTKLPFCKFLKKPLWDNCANL